MIATGVAVASVDRVIVFVVIAGKIISISDCRVLITVAGFMAVIRLWFRGRCPAMSRWTFITCWDRR